MSNQTYSQSILEHRTTRDKKTASDPLHWLNLAGLFWLEEGENSFGSADNKKIFLPQLPHADCGYFLLKEGNITIHPAKNIKITVNGKAPQARPLITDKDKNPDLIEVGAITMKIIIRGGSPMLRVWDKESQALKDFSCFHYYPIKQEYCVTAKFTHYDPPKPTIQREITGGENPGFLLGQADFTLNGSEHTLIAEKSGDQLLFNFRDGTNNETTYGGGRRIYVPIPTGNEITLDFNLTENWPCAYTPYATCPIPPPENHLPIKVEAGELKYHD